MSTLFLNADSSANADPDVDAVHDPTEWWEEVDHGFGRRSEPRPREPSYDEWWHSTAVGLGNVYRATDPIHLTDDADRDADVVPDAIPDAITDAVAYDADAIHDAIPDAITDAVVHDANAIHDAFSDADGMRDADADGRAASVGVAVGVPIDYSGLYDIALWEVREDPMFDVSFLLPYGTPYGEGYSNGIAAISALRSLFQIAIFKIGVCANPWYRFNNMKYGYHLGGHTTMTILFQGPPTLCGPLETV